MTLLINGIAQDLQWTEIDGSLEFAEFQSQKKATIGNSIITVIRINPNRYKIQLLTSKEFDEQVLQYRIGYININ